MMGMHLSEAIGDSVLGECVSVFVGIVCDGKGLYAMEREIEKKENDCMRLKKSLMMSRKKKRFRVIADDFISVSANIL